MIRLAMARIFQRCLVRFCESMSTIRIQGSNTPSQKTITSPALKGLVVRFLLAGCETCGGSRSTEQPAKSGLAMLVRIASMKLI